jgi:hypothetical protein
VSGFVVWTASESLRLIGLGDATSPISALSSVLVAGVLLTAAGAYLANLRGKVSGREEIAVYLDAAAVCAAVTGLLVALVGSRADADGAILILLIQGGLGLNILAATIILDLAVRAELRFRGAYAILIGWRCWEPDSSAVPRTWIRSAAPRGSSARSSQQACS